MSRIVVDTNIFVSGFLHRSSPPGRVLDLVIDNAVTLLVDDRIVQEYIDVLHRPRLGLNATDVARFLQETLPCAEFVTPDPLDLDLPDVDDLPFLEVAIAGHADGLVTGNGSHFIPTRGTHEMLVLSPRQLSDLV